MMIYVHSSYTYPLYELVSGVLHEWESIVNRVPRNEVGERMIICGRAAR